MALLDTKAEDWRDFASSLETNFGKAGYTLVKKCSCDRDPSKEKIKYLKEMYEKCYRSTGKVYQPKDEERLYREHVKCLHYQCPNLGHIVLTVEGFQEVLGSLGGFQEVLSSLGKAVKQGYIEGCVIGKQVSRSGGGKLDLLRESFNNRKNFGELSTPINLGVVACYTFGNDLEGKKESTDFLCKENRFGFLNESWGKKLGLPAVVKRIDEKLLRNPNLKK